ncbi:hypothetical protein SSP35_20_00930 [Streptomyces sp. NBRC 110611]|uniref:FxLD family lanthipeptide n=1 Tax=Streptomyces sp. NBRC 110611 TaxID=1621259 RepID=UPI0008580D8B|nr:FxLD family lanthipeptide [Streptomyces sp. NBRC 110611]GAU70597.1 hypothetical protein SSP35_20_00930 [Streptomyces sp. NBRC 110611]
MAPITKECRPQPVRAATPQDPFDLDVSVIESGGTVGAVAAYDGGCMATCGNACVSNAA